MPVTCVAGVIAGTIDNTVDFMLRSTSNNDGVSGKVAADMTIRYWRPLGALQTITPVDLALLTSIHTDGGVKEMDSVNAKGKYRLDLPDAALAFQSNVPFVKVFITVTGAWLEEIFIPLAPPSIPYTFSSTLLASIADGVLTRDWTAIGTTPPARCLWQAARALRNAWDYLPGIPPRYRVAKEDDDLNNPAWDADATENAAATPVTGINPAG